MLYIMRHGKTSWNAEHRLQGRTDIPLSAEGHLMAFQAREELRGIHFDKCFSSPLLRAKQTAQILFDGKNTPVICDDRLTEMCFGEFEGSTQYFTDPDHPLHTLFQQPEKYTESIGGAESFAELFFRTGEFLEAEVYPELEMGKNILIVGHGAMNSAIICRIRNLGIHEFWNAGIENCKLIRLI